MLVLTRRDDESVRIGPDVRIRILQISGRQVRLGIEAPADVLIVREELYDRAAAANRDAALADPSDAG
ncbi:MAG: carbon storage regulator CsrA [Myxococcota bacterium]